MLILIQSLIFRVNVYFPESQRWPDQTWGNTSFWKFDQSYFDRVQHPMIYDGVQILHHVWPGIRSCVIMLVSYTTNNTGKPHTLALAANQGISLTFKIWSKTTRQVTFSEPSFCCCWDFRPEFEEYDQIMQRMNRSIIHIK